jgi:hypothetical protein
VHSNTETVERPSWSKRVLLKGALGRQAVAPKGCMFYYQRQGKHNTILGAILDSEFRFMLFAWTVITFGLLGGVWIIFTLLGGEWIISMHTSHFIPPDKHFPFHIVIWVLLFWSPALILLDWIRVGLFWMISHASRGLCLAIARLICPVELEYCEVALRAENKESF